MQDFGERDTAASGNRRQDMEERGGVERLENGVGCIGQKDTTGACANC